ncbi:unnamed protein product [Amoebophrya sp. A120]|nr:unnamed protein product [Amoebophrya sp. A120]|eukprot:GSA120T00002386001.1
MVEPDVDKSMSQIVEELVYEKMCLKKEVKQLQLELLDRTTQGYSKKSLNAGGQFKGSMIVGSSSASSSSLVTNNGLVRDSPTKRKTRGGAAILNSQKYLKSNYGVSSLPSELPGEELDQLERRHQTTARELDTKTLELSEAKMRIETLELEVKWLQDARNAVARGGSPAVGDQVLLPGGEDGGGLISAAVADPPAATLESTSSGARPPTRDAVVVRRDSSLFLQCATTPVDIVAPPAAEPDRVLVVSPKRVAGAPSASTVAEYFFEDMGTLNLNVALQKEQDMAIEEVASNTGSEAVFTCGPTEQGAKAGFSAKSKLALFALLERENEHVASSLRQAVFLQWRHVVSVSRRAALSTAVQTQKKELQGARTQLDATTSKHRDQLAQLSESWTTKICTVEAAAARESQAQKGRITALAQEVEVAKEAEQKSRHEYEARIAELESALERAQADSAAAQTALRDEQITRKNAETVLQEARAELEATIEGLRQQLRDVEERERKITEEAEELRKRYNQLLSTLESATGADQYSEKKRIAREQTLLKEIAALKKELGRDPSFSPSKQGAA